MGHSCHWEATSFPNLKQATLTSGFLHNNAEIKARDWTCLAEGPQAYPLSWRMVGGRPPDMEYLFLGLGAEH